MNGWTKAFGIVILFAAAVFLFAVAMAKTDGMAIASISVDTFLADETYKKCTELAGGLVAVGGICSIAAGSKYKSAFVCVLGALVALIGVSFLMMATGNIDFSEKNVDIFLGALFGITALVGISYATSRKSVFGFIIFVILFLLAIVFKGENFDGKIIAFAGHGFPLYCFNSEMFMPILGMLIAFFVGVYFIVCSMRDTRDAKKKAAAAAEAAEEVAAEEAPAEETAEETPAEEVAAEEAPAEEAPAEAAAVAAEEVPAEETAEEAPAEPAEETPAETAVEEAPAEETAEEAPAEVVEETPAETAVEETPVETAVEEVPAEAVEETPVETAVEEAPAEPAVEEAPVEEAPVEEAPAEEAPSEEVAAAVAVGVAAEAASAEEEVPALPAIKSSQDAAAAAAAVKAENEERLSDEAAEDGENIPEEEAPAEEDEEMLSLEDLGLEPDTPETFVRRAAWNKGLRCRRDYGKHKIPVAFVKGKVAVFVDKGEPVTSKDEVLAKEGWTVFHFPEADIVDGAAEAEIVAKAVKENLKASKKKRKTTRR